MSSTSTPSNNSDSTYANFDRACADIEFAVNNRLPVAREIYPPLCYPVAVARATCIVLYILTVIFTTIYMGILLYNNKITTKDMPLIEFYTVVCVPGICIPCICLIMYAAQLCGVRN